MYTATTISNIVIEMGRKGIQIQTLNEVKRSLSNICNPHREFFGTYMCE